MPSGRVDAAGLLQPGEDRIAAYTDPSGGQWQIHAAR